MGEITMDPITDTVMDLSFRKKKLFTLGLMLHGPLGFPDTSQGALVQKLCVHSLQRISLKKTGGTPDGSSRAEIEASNRHKKNKRGRGKGIQPSGGFAALRAQIKEIGRAHV